MEFQQKNTLGDSGTVDAATWAKLLAPPKTKPGAPPPSVVPATPPGFIPLTPPVITPTDLPLNPLRARIVQIARQEIGRVSDRFPGAPYKSKNDNGHHCRIGWERLKHYMDHGMASPPNWGHPYPLPFTALNGVVYHITTLEGVSCWNMRVTNNNAAPGGGPTGANGKWTGLQWCGVFAAWVLRQAGLNVSARNIGNYLHISPSVDHKAPHFPGQIKRIDRWHAMPLPIEAGDVCIFADLSHHAIVTHAGDAAAGGLFADNDCRKRDVPGSGREQQPFPEKRRDDLQDRALTIERKAGGTLWHCP